MPSFRRSLVVVGLLIFSNNVFAQVTSDFASNAEGWTAPNALAGSFGYTATGGNPNGYISGQTPGSISLGAGLFWIPYFFQAPGKFNGNKSSYYGGNLRWDVSQTSAGAPTFEYTAVQLTNGAGVTYYFFPGTQFTAPAFGSWTTVNVPLSATGEWKTTNSSTGIAVTVAQLTAMLGDIQKLEIQGLYRNANIATRIDNVTMYPPIVISTNPADKAVCEEQVATFNAVGTNNPNIKYQWQTYNPFNGAAANLTNTLGYSGVTTSTLSVNTTGNFGGGIYYRCKISGTGVDDKYSTFALLTINPLPAVPGATGASACGPASIKLNATGGGATQYRWYTVATNGTPIPGQTASSYNTPVISATTDYYVAINNGTCESHRTKVTAVINTIPGAPVTTGGSSCGEGDITLSASNGTAGQYRWYTQSVGGSPFSGQTNSTYSTGLLSATKNYYVSINNTACESSRTLVVATINDVPSPPEINVQGDAQSCLPEVFELLASGGDDGDYRWYTQASGGTADAQQTAAFETPKINSTTTYYVALTDGICESPRVSATLTIGGADCKNSAPVISDKETTTTIGVGVTVDLTDLITDEDNNLDLSTLAVVTQPSSGVQAVIDEAGRLMVDYSGSSFAGIDQLTIRVCDTYGVCTEQTLKIDVIGEIVIFNAVSPNRDGKNDVFFVQNIDKLNNTKENHVTIFNRWGDLVWEGTDYNNTTVAFAGFNKNNGELPSGTYYYKIEFTGGLKMETGYLELKR
jgi:gliding motility-associated-like protein